MGREQGDVAALDQALVQGAVDLHAVVHVADAVFLDAAVVLQYQQGFHLQVPQRVEQGRRAAPHAALGAGLDRRLEQLEEADAAGVLGLAATDGAADGADAPGVDADASAQGHVLDDGRGSGVDRVQAVTALDQHAGAELARGRTHAGHDRGRQGNLEQRDGIVEALDVIQPGVARVVGEQAHADQHVEHLRAFIDPAADPVLDQVLAFQLLDRGVGEGQVAAVIKVVVQGVEFVTAVVAQDVLIVALHLGQRGHVIEQVWRFELTIGYLAQMEDRQARGHVLIIRRLGGNQIGGGLDDGLVDILTADSVVQLDLGFQFDLRHRHIVQPLGGPLQNAMDLVQIDGLLAAVALGYLEGLEIGHGAYPGVLRLDLAIKPLYGMNHYI